MRRRVLMVLLSCSVGARDAREVLMSRLRHDLSHDWVPYPA
jgi:hypothetical protein